MPKSDTVPQVRPTLDFSSLLWEGLTTVAKYLGMVKNSTNTPLTYALLVCRAKLR